MFLVIFKSDIHYSNFWPRAVILVILVEVATLIVEVHAKLYSNNWLQLLLNWQFQKFKHYTCPTLQITHCEHIKIKSGYVFSYILKWY